MLIGIMSDSHDNIPATNDAVARLNREGAERVLHAGDIVSPFVLTSLSKIAVPMTLVFGNNDGDHALLTKKCSEYPHMRIAGSFARIQESRFSIALLHGSDKELLMTLKECSSLDLIVSGHSHIAIIEKVGTKIHINPGEVCGYLSGRRTVALFDTKTRNGEILDL